MDRAALVAAILVLVAVAAALLRRRRTSPRGPLVVEPDELGLTGERVAVVGFSSRYCVPCRAWEEALGRAGVPWVKVDVGERPDLPRRYGISSTPLVLAVELPAGRVLERYVDEPRPADVERLAALAGSR